MAETSLAIREAGPLTLMPAMSVEQAVNRYKAVTEFVGEMMNEGVDFGTVPGTGDKKTLLKPGAEKLTTFFGLSKRFAIVEKTEDWTGKDHNGEPFFYYIYRCALYAGETLIAEADGSANSFESKYRYRKGERTCPQCNAAAIIKGKAEYGGGWICFSKKGGCGAKFEDSDPNITQQVVGRILNVDICDQVNTLQKMAQKRALVGATLLAVNASEFFTQDLEDFEHTEPTNGASQRMQSKTTNINKVTQSAVASGAEHKLNELLFAHCVKLKKNERNAQAYFDAMFDKLSFEQKQAKAIELKLIIDQPPAEAEPQPQEPQREFGAILDSIETITNEIVDLGIKPDDVAHIVNAMTGHKPIQECSVEVLEQVEARLIKEREKLQKKQKKEEAA
jgi:hypothetical protein